MTQPTMPIREFLFDLFAMQRDLEPQTVSQHRYVIESLERFLGRVALLEDLRHEVLNRWLAGLQQTELSRETVKSRRRLLLVLWRSAFEQELVNSAPQRIRKIKTPAKVPKCWSADQLGALMAAAAATPGQWRGNGIAKAAWWKAWILVNYNTGLRLSDMLRIERESIMPDGRFTVVQHKTGKPIDCRLPLDAIEAADAIGATSRRFVFGGVLNRRTIQDEFKHLTYRAKVPGSIKWLRKSGATHCEAATPGSASDFLGHRSPELARRHYLDPRFLKRSTALPPAIG